MIGHMRRLVVRTTLVVVTLALLVFAIPFGVAARFWFFGDERGELERQALAAAVQVGPQFTDGDPIELPAAESDISVGVYDLQGRLEAGRGPSTAADVVTRAASSGSVVDSQDGGELIVAVPATSAESVVAVVRAAVPVGLVWQRIIWTWLTELGLAGCALLIAMLVARRQARALTAPLEALSETSSRIADGDLTARAASSRIPEIAQVAETHNAMIEQLTVMVERGRHFNADASHQLRTPLTGLQLGLDAALEDPAADAHELRAVLASSRDQVENLHRRLDDVLELAKAGRGRWPTATQTSVATAVEELERRWHGRFADRGRLIAVHIDDTVGAQMVPTSLLAQVLDVLADNTFHHGRGTLTVAVREIGGALAIDLADEGSLLLTGDLLFNRGISGSGGPGIGLALARQLTESIDGRLVLARSDPTTFTVLLPAPDPAPVSPGELPTNPAGRTSPSAELGMANREASC